MLTVRHAVQGLDGEGIRSAHGDAKVKRGLVR